jgi:hypothetical protein
VFYKDLTARQTKLANIASLVTLMTAGKTFSFHKVKTIFSIHITYGRVQNVILTAKTNFKLFTSRQYVHLFTYLKMARS